MLDLLGAVMVNPVRKYHHTQQILGVYQDGGTPYAYIQNYIDAFQEIIDRKK